MNGRERMLCALRREEPDTVPIWELIVNQPVVDDALGQGQAYADFCDHFDLDGVTCGEDQRVEWVSSEQYKDEWGILWKVTQNGLSYPSGGPIRKREDISAFKAPDPDAVGRLRTLEDMVRRFRGRRAVVFLGHEAFEFSHYLAGGLKNLFLLYAREPGYAKQLADVVSEYKVRVMERAADVGADVLLTGDDYCNSHGPLMSPVQFRRFVLPYLRSAVRCARHVGVPFIKHTDGHLWPILQDMVDSGIDGLDPLEPAAGMDIGEVKSRYAHRLCVVGNVDCTHVLSMGTPHEVEEAVKETIAKASPGGGHILASSNSIHPGVRASNYLYMIRIARELGRYPIDEKLVTEYRTKSYASKLFGESAWPGL